MIFKMGKVLFMLHYVNYLADPGGHAVYGADLRPLDCWDRGFTFH